MSVNDLYQPLFCKIESVYGTDPTPTGAANAILCEGLEITPLKMAMNEREFARQGFDTEIAVPAELNASVKFSVELSPGSAAGLAPQFGPALRACGMAEVLTADTDAVYAPVASVFESVTLWGYKEGTRHKVKGARGTFTIETPPNKLPKINFDLMGLFTDPDDSGPLTPTYAGFLEPKPINKANTTFTVDGVACVLNAFSLQLGNRPVYRDRPNLEEVAIDGRATAGSLTIHKPALSSLNAFTKAKTPTTVPIVLTHTLSAGRTAAIGVPVAQLGDPSYGKDGNQVLLTAPFTQRRNGSSAGLTLTFV